MKHNKFVIFVSVTLAGLLMMVLLKSMLDSPSAFVVEQSEEFINIRPDSIEIEKGDLKYCCQITFGSQKRGCWMLKKFSCDYCKPYCDE